MDKLLPSGRQVNISRELTRDETIRLAESSGEWDWSRFLQSLGTGAAAWAAVSYQLQVMLWERAGVPY